MTIHENLLEFQNKNLSIDKLYQRFFLDNEIRRNNVLGLYDKCKDFLDHKGKGFLVNMQKDFLGHRLELLICNALLINGSNIISKNQTYGPDFIVKLKDLNIFFECTSTKDNSEDNRTAYPMHKFDSNGNFFGSPSRYDNMRPYVMKLLYSLDGKGKSYKKYIEKGNIDTDIGFLSIDTKLDICLVCISLENELYFDIESILERTLYGNGNIIVSRKGEVLGLESTIKKKGTFTESEESPKNSFKAFFENKNNSHIDGVVFSEFSISSSKNKEYNFTNMLLYLNPKINNNKKKIILDNFKFKNT